MPSALGGQCKPRAAAKNLKRNPEKTVLDESDIHSILQNVPNAEKLPRDAQQRLLLLINLIAPWPSRLHHWRKAHAPYKSLAKLQAAEKSFEEALAVLHDPTVREALMWEIEVICGLRSASMEELRTEYPDEDELTLRHAHTMGCVLPRDSTKEVIVGLAERLSWGRDLAKLAHSRVRARQAPGGGLVRLQRPEKARYDFITALALIFEDVFKSRPSAFREGQWCAFLAATLSRVEGTELTVEGAYDLWLRVRRWEKDLSPAVTR